MNRLTTPRWTPEALQEWARWEAEGDAGREPTPAPADAEHDGDGLSAAQQRWIDLNA